MMLMIQNRLKHHRRYQEIVNAFIKNGFSHLLHRFGLIDKSPIKKDKATADAENFTDIGIHLKQTLQSLGPTFIKLGQIASSRRDLVPEEVAKELEKLQDEVQAFPYETVAAIITEELGAPPQEMFEHFSETPLATASIGQVHVATLKTGEEVAIKIQRPDIEKMIHTDLEILANIVRMLDKRFKWARNYRLKEMLDEFSFSLRNELNYLIEGRHGERIAQQFIDRDDIHVPRIYWAYTSAKVLTMDMIRGIKVNKYEQLEREGYNRSTIAAKITDAMFHQILEVGVFHGDPHAGNIFVLPNNEIAFLDFGMVGQLSEEMKYYFSSLIISLQSNDTDGIMKTFDDWGLTENVVDRNGLRRDIDTLQLKYYDTSLQKMSLGKIMIEIFTIAYKHEIKIPSDIAILAKVILTLESIIEGLDEHFSIMKAVEPYGKKLIMKRYNPLNMASQITKDLIDNAKIISSLPKELKDISQTLKKGKLHFDVNIFRLQDIMKRLDLITNKLSFSIILLAFSILMTGLVIGASISGQSGILFKLPVIEIGSIIATLMFLYMIFVIFRSGRM